MERKRQSHGSAILTELLTSTDSRLFRSRSMRLGPSLGLWTVWTVWLRCLWLRSSPRLRCSHVYVGPRPYYRRRSYYY